MKKNLIFLFLCTFFVLTFMNNTVEAEEVQQGLSIDLSTLGDLNFGETIYLDGDVEVTTYTRKEASEILKKENQTYNPYTRACSTQAVAFRSPVVVKKGSTVQNYSPTLNIWTELCQNSVGQYVISKIIGTTFERLSNNQTHGFQGTVLTSSLNSGKTLFHAIDGNWIRNVTHTLGSQSGVGTPFASFSFTAASTTNVFGYTDQSANTILFK